MITGVGFLPDGKTLLSVSQDHSIRWWDVVAGSEIGSQALHDAGFLALAMAPGTRLAITAGNDGALRVVEVPA